MAYQITFTKRFEKHFKDLNAQEKKQLQNKLRLLAENPMHPSLRTKRIQGTSLSAVSTWTFALSGTMKATS